MEKLREYPLVQKEMLASLHNWSRENMEMDILALMETLQKACRNVTESLNSEDGDPRGMHNPKTIIETMAQMCEIMKTLIAGFGHVHGTIPSQCVMSVRCSSAASRRFRRTAGGQPEEVQSLIDKYALKATCAEIKLAESVDECNSLRKEMAKSSHERDSHSADECISLRKESENLRIELEKSVDKCESRRKAATQSVDECISLRREVANLRRELAESVDECGSQRREAAKSAEECISLRRELARSVEEFESLRREAARSVDECTSLGYSVVDSGLSNVEEPTLALLQSCISTVEIAIRQCADEMIALQESAGSVTCNLYDVMRKVRRQKEHGESRRLLYDKIAWQAVLSECMFRAFEDPSFMLKHTALFKELVTKKKGRFRYYMSVKDMDPHDLYGQDKSFFEFVHHKKELLKSLFIKHLTYRGLFAADLKILDEIPSTFLGLGHRVWRLHKLAFPFEPLHAEIFQVEKDSIFMGNYMFEPDDICRQQSQPARAGRTVAFAFEPLHAEIEIEDNVLFEDYIFRRQQSQPARARRTVALMLLPGFTLGNSIIKAKVCCMESLIS
ncbi:hypothetical protein KP509_10G061800 [Ceratopteris richardii]|nr:hypothetical protein KP509_10G061800 [Ceratopteris richardii]